MRKILFFILYLKLIALSNSFFPIWVFNNVAKPKSFKYEDHLEYIICDKDSNNVHITLTKQLKMSDLDNQTPNLLELDIDNYMGFFSFEDIDSAYRKNVQYYFVCPKGKYHLHLFKWTYNFEILKPNSFSIDSDWELKCYWELEENLLYVGYLNSNIKLYQFNLNTEQYDERYIYNGIFDFKWNTESLVNNKKKVLSLTIYNKQLLLDELEFTIKNRNNINYTSLATKIIYDLKSNSNAYFDGINRSYNFYWITYEKNNAFNFDSGYYNGNEEITKDNIDKINIIKNIDKSPFEFYDKISIEQINFIPYTKYAYYKIHNEDKNEIYYGIIDIILNRIIFNTNVEIQKFIPYSHNCMLAIYNYKPYEICAIRNSEGSSDECPKGEKPIYYMEKANYCGTGCDYNYYTFMPYEYCIETCDEKLYAKKNKQCGLCKDLFPETPFKMVNYTGCLEKQPENTYFINKNLKLLACNDGIEFIDGRCGQMICYKNCLKCYGESDNINEQKCISCKNNYVLQGENCIDKCLDGFYKDENNLCKKCNDDCEKCINNPNTCYECKSGFYLEELNCKKCTNNCGTCKKEENNNIKCLTCNQDSEYKYFFEDNCYIICPPNTTNSTNNKCIINEKKDEDDNNNENEEEQKDENKNENDGENKKDNNKTSNRIYLSGFIVVFYLIIIIISVCFFKKNCCPKNDNNDKMINEIYKELI